MLLSEIVEEIAEKSDNYLSPQSIIRKINFIKGNLIRNYSNNDLVVSQMDVEEGLAQYPLIVPAGSIRSVMVDDCPYPLRRLNESPYSRYYYLLSGTIGISPTPIEDIPGGLRIFHERVSRQLTINDMNGEPDFDSEYHMLFVYGVLAEIHKGGESSEYKAKYEDLLREYLIANADPENPQIRMEDW